MIERDLICIGCPLGCNIHVIQGDDGSFDISGNTCNRGAEYAKKELTDPRRIVTSVVKVKDGREAVVSVKTESDIPKGKIFECVKELAQVIVEAPVHIGDVVLEDVAGSGVNVIATKNLEKK